MYKLISISAGNLGSFKKLNYSINQGVTTLVFGNNLDNDSQKSNGSGKSMLIEAIALGITGDTLRKIKVDEIINNEDEDATIALIFQNDFETFTIDRQIFRKGSSIVNCSIARNGELVTTDEAVQSSVAEYNKYILEKLGVSKDELFNNFILSKHKYEDFLSSSDKEKKEIINRFSNGNMVDISIEKLLQDKVPVEKELRAIELSAANLSGRISMLNDQIKHEESTKGQKALDAEQKISNLKQSIVSKREFIVTTRSTIQEINGQIESVKKTDEAVQVLESSEDSIEELNDKMKAQFEQFAGVMLKDWNATINGLIEQSEAIKKECNNLQVNVENELTALALLKSSAEIAKKNSIATDSKGDLRIAEIETEVKQIKESIDDVTKLGISLRNSKTNLSVSIENIENSLKKSVKCPKCSHEFVVSDKDFDVEAGKIALEKSKEEIKGVDAEMVAKRKQLVDLNAKQETVESEIQTVNKLKRMMLNKLEDAKSNIVESEGNIRRIERATELKREELVTISNQIANIRKRIFDDAFGIIDRLYGNFENKIKGCECEIEAATGSIKTLQDSIEEILKADENDIIKSLKESLESNEKDLIAVERDRQAKQEEFNTFVAQEQRFIEFKTYLANTKIEALGKVTNEFLSSIGSDIRIKFSGYTVLKSGKVRDKISISLIRDGIDCGSFGKFSAGEQARVNLATILAMQKLVNSNCESGKGIDLLVLDEVLDGSDELGLSNMFEALNALGITAIAVSHGNIAENYPHRLIINKQNGESTINEK